MSPLFEGCSEWIYLKPRTFSFRVTYSTDVFPLLLPSGDEGLALSQSDE